MDSMRLFDAIDRVEHRHGENDWHPMRAEDPRGGPASRDRERDWAGAKMYRCQSSDDSIRITRRADDSGSVR
jgi:hypothetical protein